MTASREQLQARLDAARERCSRVAVRDHLQGPAYAKAYTALVRAERILARSTEQETNR